MAVPCHEIEADDVGLGCVDGDVHLVDIGGWLEFHGLRADGELLGEGDALAAQGLEALVGGLRHDVAVGSLLEFQHARDGPQALSGTVGDVPGIVPVGDPADGDHVVQRPVIVAENAGCIEVEALVDILGRLGLSLADGKGLSVEIAHEILLLGPVDGQDHDPFLLVRPLDGNLDEVGAFPGLLGISGGTEVAGPGPVFQVRGSVDAHLLGQDLSDDHHPLPCLLVPEDGRIPEFRAPFVQDGVLVIPVERASVLAE